jgi:hypothetical protein
MKLKDRVKPISYIKNHAAEILRESDRNPTKFNHHPTRCGRSRIAGTGEYERTRETLALLKILAQSTQSLQQGKTKDSEKVFTDVRKSLKEGKR